MQRWHGGEKNMVVPDIRVKNANNSTCAKGARITAQTMTTSQNYNRATLTFDNLDDTIDVNGMTTYSAAKNIIGLNGHYVMVSDNDEMVNASCSMCGVEFEVPVMDDASMNVVTKAYLYGWFASHDCGEEPTDLAATRYLNASVTQ